MATKTATQNIKTTPRKTNAKRPLAKRPATRRVQPRPSEFGRVWRKNLHWLFLGGAAIVCGVLLFVGYQKVVASSLFNVKRIDVAGAKHVERAEIERIVRENTFKSGVWNADLDQVRKDIEQISWVKTATVSRVLPDSLRVRMSEREPKAVVRLQSGARVWVDDEARVLGAIGNASDSPFVMNGWNEDRSNDATKHNQERVRLYLKLVKEWQQAELIKSVSAVNLTDLQDVECIVEQNGHTITVKIGNKNFSQRLKTALTTLNAVAASGDLKNVEKIINYDEHPIVSYKNFRK